MTPETPPTQKKESWIKNSISIKVLTIVALILLLLIPSSMIQSLISEREALNNQAIAEVSAKWAESQQINGPILTIPIVYEYEVEVKDEETKTKTVTKNWYILPEVLNINGNVEPEKLRRGIYEVVVYKSDLNISGQFKLNQKIDEPNIKEIQYDNAFVTIGISDLRGIKNQIKVKWGSQNLGVEPGSRISSHIYSGVTINTAINPEQLNKVIEFSFQLDLQGSQNMTFVPVGSFTDIQLNSTWPSPKFNGNFLPDTRIVNKDGFEANWKILQLNRNFPQSWIGENQSEKLQASAFGVDLILPLDDYQKSMRSAKYAAMTIALTFLIFFLVEILNKRKIHPFQYGLVGLALCLFYTLLVSISEHSNFNVAYGISTIGIVTMIALYSITILKSRMLTSILVIVLFGIYGFLFVTLQMEDYALLMGSIGLTLILGATMYFTRNINWYQVNREEQ
jgi:inner membrane protein